MAIEIFGLILFGLGCINQIVRHPDMDFDLALRTGNGGFIIDGLALAFLGYLVNRYGMRLKHF